nr:hypothetical protein [Tanacetum cinerariifolium]
MVMMHQRDMGYCLLRNQEYREESRDREAHPDIEPERMLVENKFYLDNINAVSVEELPVNSLTNDGCLSFLNLS